MVAVVVVVVVVVVAVVVAFVAGYVVGVGGVVSVIAPMVTQGEIERQLFAIGRALEEQTDVFAQAARTAAVAEADYKLNVAQAWLDVAVEFPRATVVERNARAEVACVVELRGWKIAQASRDSAKEALLSFRARLDSLRSLLASVRGQT